MEEWKLLNKCPVCGSRLEYCAMMSCTEDRQIRLDGKQSVKSKRSEICSMECGFIVCKNPDCDFATDCDFTPTSNEYGYLKIKPQGDIFLYRDGEG